MCSIGLAGGTVDRNPLPTVQSLGGFNPRAMSSIPGPWAQFLGCGFNPWPWVQSLGCGLNPWVGSIPGPWAQSLGRGLNPWAVGSIPGPWAQSLGRGLRPWAVGSVPGPWAPSLGWEDSTCSQHATTTECTCCDCGAREPRASVPQQEKTQQ